MSRKDGVAPPKAAARTKRLAEALRANLKRRKAAAKAGSGAATARRTPN
jgi:hypothetical protein